MTRAKEDITVRAAEPGDAPAIADIYNHYVRTSVITFEEEPVTAAEIAQRIAEVQSTPLPWLVADRRGGVAGYAYATRWKNRTAYRFSVEVTVYVAPECSGHRIGSLL